MASVVLIFRGSPDLRLRRIYYPFFLPAFLLLLFFSVYSLLGVIVLSFDQIDLRRPDVRGFSALNYLRLMRDGRFWNAIKVSFLWLLATTSGSMSIGLAIALFLFRRFPVAEPLVSVFLVLPATLSRVGVALIWKLIYRTFGILNYFLSLLGLELVSFLTEPKLAFISVTIVDIWQWSFLVSFLCLSLLNSIPPNYIEEAMVEGASRWEVHRFISLPMISRGLLSVFFMKLVESLRTFDLVYNLTQGGPGITTETLDLYAFYQGVTIGGEISYAASMSVVMLIFTLVVLTILWRYLWRKKEEE